MGAVEVLDKIFGGPDSIRGLIQAIGLYVVAIILWSVAAVLPLSAALMLFFNPLAAVQATAMAGVLGGIAYIPFIIACVGIVWWILRKADVISG